jgi:hypothetical protein
VFLCQFEQELWSFTIDTYARQWRVAGNIHLTSLDMFFLVNCETQEEVDEL